MGPALVALALLATHPWSPGSAAAPAARLRVPVARAARPTTLPQDEFAVRFEAGGVQNARGRWGAPLAAGAGYGVDDRLEVGIRLLDWVAGAAEDPRAGLFAPTAYGRARAATGPLEIGGGLAVQLPLEGFTAADVEAFSRLHFGARGALDLSIRAGGRFQASTRWPGRALAELSLSPARRFTASAGAELGAADLAAPPDRRRLWVRARGALTLTLGEPSQVPLWDLELRYRSPPRGLSALPPDLGHEGSLLVRLFFDDPDDDRDFR